MASIYILVFNGLLAVNLQKLVNGSVALNGRSLQFGKHLLQGHLPFFFHWLLEVMALIQELQIIPFGSSESKVLISSRTFKCNPASINTVKSIINVDKYSNWMPFKQIGNTCSYAINLVASALEKQLIVASLDIGKVD